jgi:hypothetical protein
MLGLEDRMSFPLARRPRNAVASLIVGAALGLSVAAPARAAGGDAATAEVLFREGRKLSDAGDVQGACAKFRESRRLDPAVGTTFNIADCEERLGNLTEAWSSFQEVVQLLPATDKRRPIAVERAAALEKRLPRLKVRLEPGAPAGTRVVRDGVELGAASLGVELPVNPGAHGVVVTAPGRAERVYDVALVEAQHLSLDVAPGAAAEPGKEPAPPLRNKPTTGSRGDRTLAYVLGGIGIAGVVTGTVAGIVTLNKKSTVDDNCNAQKQCTDAGLAAADTGQQWANIATFGFVVGAVGLGAGTYFFLAASPTRDGVTGATATLRGQF